MQGWVAALAIAFIAMSRAGHCYEPRVNYQLQCQGCHLADGSGQSDRVPSFRGTLIPLSGMPEGRVFVLTVPGVAQSPLSDAETAALLNWMARNLSDEPLPATFKDYTAEEVRKHRGHPLAQVADVRGDLLRRLADGVNTVIRGASGTMPR
jgi:hypothetical protein